MDNVKHWIVSKCKEAGEQVSSIKSFRPDIPCKVFTNVVTPNSIPEFTIPGTSDSSSSCDDLEDPSYSCSAASSPRTSAGDICNPNPLLVIPSPTHFSRSAPVSPSRPPQIRLQQQDSHSLSCLKDTNADPLSIAAVSLPHFRTTTRFGFQTVSENPHVRRKESLFHDGSNSNTPLLPRRGRVKHTSSDGLSTRSTSVSPGPRQRDTAIPDDLALEDTFTRGRRSTRGKPPPTVVAPLGVYIPRCGSTGSDSPCVSPTPSSPLDSPSSTTDISKLPLCRFMTDSPLLRTDSKRSNYYYRRRSSVSIGSDTSGGDSSQTDENEQIPNFRKCPNGTIEPVHGQPIKRHSNPTVSRPKPPTFASGEIPKSQSLNSGISYLKRCKRGSSDKELEENRDGALLGELKLAIKYSEDERKLKVTAIRAENLGGSLRQENNINPYLKLCLVPGKMQKQTSAIYKHCKNPIFQQDFWFNDVCLDELQRMRLRIRVCSKGHHIIGDEFLGEVLVTLSDLDLSEETRMWKRLEPKSDKEDSGFIEVGICFEPKHERLKIKIIQAKGLPKYSLTGQPDPYVKIRVSQPGRPEIKRQTRIKKKSSQPQFDESFEFIISPRVEDLNYTTVTLTVLSHETIRTDDVIGHVRFGFRSTQETETNHWQQVLVFPGKEYTLCHTIVQKNES